MRKLGLTLSALVLSGCASQASDRIIPYGRENNSGTYMYFKEHVLEDEDFAAYVQTLPGTAAVINAVSRDPRSIGYGGIGYVKGVRIVRVKQEEASPGAEPTLENVVDGTYPISRFLYFYTVGEPQGEVRDFIDWVLGDEGQEVCEKVGYYPLPPDRRRPAAAPGPPGEARTITIKGSDTMVILGQRWAEHYMQKQPGTLVQVTGGGSGTGIAALINGATDICQASRPMKPKEAAQIRMNFGKDPAEFPVAMDGIAIFVHESSPIQELTLAQLKGIYTGTIRSWTELGRTGE